MNLSKEDQTLLALLGYAVFGRELTISAENVDWDQVIAEADRHVVMAFLYPGVKRLAGVPEGVVNRIRSAAMMSAAKSDEMLHTQDAIITCLKEKGIPCAVLKGYSVACHYPYPELRVPGDIDLLARADELESACKALEDAGFERELTLEKHECLSRQDAWVEMHQMVTTFPDTPKGIHAKEFMTGAIERVTEAEINGVHFPILNGVDQLIGLLAHKEQHLATSGIGLRQICDWAVTVHAMRDTIGAKEIDELEKCGLLRFAQAVTKLCEKYLGMPPVSWCQDAPDAQADALMKDVWEAGNFHVQGEKRPFTSVLTDAYGTGKQSVWKNYIRYIRKRLHQDYPWARNPLWIVAFGVFFPARYGIRALLGKRRKIDIAEAVHTARSREKMLRDLNLYQ